jgi:glycogen debranching enzyme
LLYSCENEEQEFYGSSTYDLPGYGRLKFAGFAGVKRMLKEITKQNDLGHPLCDNLRKGNWLLDYYSARLKRRTCSVKLSTWLGYAFTLLKKTPRYLIPRYFQQIINQVISELESCFLQNFKRHNMLLQNGLFRALVLSCPQFVSKVRPNEPALLSAGLPFFTTGCWKSWGRDTFISLKGCLIIPGLWREARAII